MFRYRNFNLICLVVNLFFIIGSFWVWRGEIVQALSDDEILDIQLVTKSDIVETANDNFLDKHPQAGQTNPATEEIKKEEVEIKEKKKKDLPSINLLVPFASQAPEKNWDQPWQDACEEAAVLMLAAYYNQYNVSPLFAKDEILKMIDWETDQGFGTSLEMGKIKELAAWYTKGEKQIYIIENPSVDQIKQYIANGQPVLTVAYGKDLPNPHFRNGGPEYHALIIRGFTDTQFITNDPGTQFGENLRYDYADLLDAVHDWNGGQVEIGRQVVLIIN